MSRVSSAKAVGDPLLMASMESMSNENINASHAAHTKLSGGKSEKRDSGSATIWISEDLLALSSKLKTIIPKGTWESLGSELEIEEENGRNTKKRPQVRVTFEVRRDVLLHQRMVHTSYLTKEASEDSRDQRGTTNTMYEVSRDEVDVGVQAVVPRVDEKSQTPFSRKVDAISQAEPTLVDACIRSIQVPHNEKPNMTAFFNKVLPRVLHCLTQNNALPIYQDEFAMFTEDDAIVGTRDDTVLIEKGNYTHTTMKDLKVSSISWRSSRIKDDYVCIASVARHSFDQRMEFERRCETTISLVWDLSDPMHPRCLLEAPVEIQVLEFNPTKPNLIVGGAMNGQLFLWDLNQAAGTQVGLSAVAGKSMMDAKEMAFRPEAGAKDIPPMAESVKGLSIERDGDVMVPRLQPIQCSRVELSHKRPVHGIQWMPNGLECGFDGKQTVTDEGRQFASLSDDGYICVWDIRPEHLPADKLRKMKHQGRVGGEEFPWVPLLRFQLSRPSGGAGGGAMGAAGGGVGGGRGGGNTGGDLMGFRFHVDGMQQNDSPSYTACCGSMNGEVAFCSMFTPDERREFASNNEETRVVRMVTRGHAGPVYIVQRHPTVSDVYLTCGDFQFKLWRVGMNRPIFASPQHEVPITCACWSPTRVSVILVGTMDGKVQVWDLLDRNREPLLVHQLVQDAITVIKFKPVPAVLPPQYAQYVAIGTSVGSFHWYALPRVLSRGPSGEQRHFRAMLEREVRRVHYYTWRWSERERERDRYGTAASRVFGKARANITNEAKDEKGEMALTRNDLDDNFYAFDNHRDTEFLEKAGGPFSDGEKMELDMDQSSEELCLTED